MDFTFTEDQELFRDSAREFLVNEVTAEKVRELWETETGRSPALWGQLAELGLTAITVPEEHGGLGMNELDMVLIAMECGYVALPEPLLDTVLVAAPMLAQLSIGAEWLPKIASGEAKVAVGHGINPFVADAHVADLLLLQYGDEVHALTQDQVKLTRNESVDPSRRIFRVEWTPSNATRVASDAQALWNQTLNRAALSCAAQSLGAAQRMIDISVQYTSERHQFGKPIGSFQAVKHHMANVAYKLEYAKAPLYRAAYAIAHGQAIADVAVSHAKIAASEVGQIAAKNGIQVHGAMGYTWEVDLHIFMKRAWTLDNTWGDRAFHKQRVAEFVLADNAPIGAGFTFAA